ncbi:Arabidopsis thaliana aldehyde oxidase 1, RADIATION SENSITIVE23B [Hibiscus trionum]|nr:Arabidopsis thaliana aldehyde oxidase 1, RADIATION SENSITIVE23B [Hibiscus trionum]
MKLTVKTLKGSHFEVRAQPNYTVMAVKKTIEDIQGKDNYPCGQQLLIHNGKVLKDDTTLADNKVSDDGFLVVMLGKSKSSGLAGTSSAQSASSTPSTTAPVSNPTPTSEASAQAPASKGTISASDAATADPHANTYSEAAPNLISGTNLEQTIQQLLDMGGGDWDKETVSRALRAAYNNPEIAVDYLYSGIPESAEVDVPIASFPTSQATEAAVAPVAPVSGAPNSSPFNMFPAETLSGAGGLESLDFLRNNQQFQALRSMVQANPEILRPMLRELGKQNPQILRQIQEHREEFLQLINEPLEESEEDIFYEAEQDMSHAIAINVTPAEQEAIQRLEAMGFERGLVLEAFMACDRNEELAANYLLENAEDFED